MKMNKKIKVLMTASTFPRWEGDTEPRFVLDLAKSLLPYADVTVLAPAALGAAEREMLEGVNVIRYRYLPFRKLQTLCYPGAIVPRIREKKIRVLQVPFLVVSLWFHILKLQKEYDVVHAHWLIPQGVVQSFFSVPYLVTGHGGDVTSLNYPIVNYFRRRCLRKAETVTAVSAQIKQRICELYPNDKTQILPMGCWTEQFGKRYAVEDYFGQNGKKVILFVGRLAEKKGLTFLIDAMHEIDALLVVVGEGPLEPDLKSQASRLDGKVRFLGAKTHTELKWIYASADIFAAPSITAKDGDKEGLSLVILEAMASGLPVVASHSGGITDIVKDRINGILVPEKDSDALARALNRLLINEEERREFSLQSVRTAERFDYRLTGKKYADIICGIVADKMR